MSGNYTFEDILIRQLSGDKDTLQLFNELFANETQLFYGVIDAEFDDIERDGGSSVLSKLVPKIFKKKRSANVIRRLEPKNVVVKSTEDTGSVIMKFYHKTKIMETVPTESAVIVNEVDSPTTPVAGKFIKDCEGQDFCDISRLRNETEDVYVVLSYKDMQLKSVNKEVIGDKDLYTFVTIFHHQQASEGDPDTAIFFPACEDHKKYHYYLKPNDSTKPQSSITVEKVCINEMSENEIWLENSKHMVFTQSYSNTGATANGHSHVQSAEEKGIHTSSPAKHFQLPTEVERD